MKMPLIRVRTGLRGGQSGGYVNGVFYPDMSGYCSGTTPPPTTPPPTTTPPPSGGGWVGGVFYPDMSGTCG